MSWLTNADRAAIAERVRAKRIAQGLPETITDTVMLGRLADRAAVARTRREAVEQQGSAA